MTVTISKNSTEEILAAVNRGEYDKVTLAEYMQASFLTLFNGDDHHVDQKVMYGGNLFTLHTCIAAVSPPQDTVILEEKV